MLPLIMTNRTAGLIFDMAYIIWLLPKVIYSYTHKIDVSMKTNDRRSGAILIVCIWIGIFLAYALAHAGRQFFISWQPVYIFALGILLMIAGVAFRFYAIMVLGKYFTLRISIQPGQTLIQNGPYRWIRHPSYTGALITLSGLGLVFTNWLSLISVLVVGWIGYSYRVWVEEATLIAAIGDPYREYMKHTKRFIPFVY